MRHMRIAERIFNRPLMISEGKLNTILHLFGQRAGLDLVGVPAPAAIDMSESDRALSGYQVKNGVAIIGIHGPMMHRVLAMEFPSGGPTTYADIRNAFDMALADDGVQGIVLDIDSPGGEVNGVFDLADHIYQMRSVKPITAVVNEQAYSAGYLLASAAEKIVLPRTGGVGSIGVIATHTEISKWEKETGIAVTHIYAGARKADFSMHQPLSSEAASLLQGMVDENYLLFVETVARNRGISTQAVLDTEAGLFEGKHAVKAKLADEVSAVDRAIAGARKGKGTKLIAASAPAGATKKETIMDINELKAQHPDLVTQIETQARQGMIAQAEADTAKAEAVTAERSRVMGLVGTCLGEETGTRMNAIVDANLSTEQVKQLGITLVGQNAAGGTNAAMLDAITNAAPTGMSAAAAQPDADRKAVVSGIAAGGSSR